MTVVRLIAYLRVSTEEQKKSGLGLAAQDEAIRAECKRRGWTIVSVARDEGISAKNLHRPALLRSLERIAARGADGLIVAKLDRVSRNTLDFLELVDWFVRADAAFVALDSPLDTSTVNGRLVATMFAGMAQWEREIIGGRVRDAMAQLRKEGKPTGPPKVADRPELAERIRRLVREEGWSLRQVAAQLTAEGIPTARGAKTWSHSSVQTAAGWTRPRPRRKPADLPEPAPRRRRRRER